MTKGAPSASFSRPRDHSDFVISFSGPRCLESLVSLDYFRKLDTPRTILWCYAIWYGVVLVRYFDANPQIWLTSLGLSAIIGCALLLSTRAAMKGPPMAGWGVFRLFLMPFCVSSFSALVKGRGFILIFSPKLEETLTAAALCAVFCGSIVLFRRRRASA
jgi:hypothetical protein